MSVSVGVGVGWGCTKHDSLAVYRSISRTVSDPIRLGACSTYATAFCTYRLPRAAPLYCTAPERRPDKLRPASRLSSVVLPVGVVCAVGGARMSGISNAISNGISNQ